MKPPVKITNPGFARLASLGSFSVRIVESSAVARQKIKTTAEYAKTKSPNDSTEDIIERCARSILAEEYIAKFMEGQYSAGKEDLDDPYTWAYDVLSNQKYSGLRVEVKTTTAQKWISCSTGKMEPYPSYGFKGISFAGTMNHQIADLVIVLRVSLNDGVFTYKPVFLFTPDVLEEHVGFVRESNYDGWYLRSGFEGQENYSFKEF